MLVDFRFPNGATIQVEMEPIAEFRDDLVRQVARGDDPGSVEGQDRSRMLRDDLVRLSSQQLVVLVTEISHLVLAYGREIKRLHALNPPP